MSGTFKDPAGVTQAGHTGPKPTANPKKAWVVCTHLLYSDCTDPFSFKF